MKAILPLFTGLSYTYLVCELNKKAIMRIDHRCLPKAGAFKFYTKLISSRNNNL